ncbi:MAG: hypothetical protein LBM38_00650 [Clostridiales bacterium]|jgi:hypothetical protein|nr:hypothetical protein [Clostridiales bacterium]
MSIKSTETENKGIKGILNKLFNNKDESTKGSSKLILPSKKADQPPKTRKSWIKTFDESSFDFIETEEGVACAWQTIVSDVKGNQYQVYPYPASTKFQINLKNGDSLIVPRGNIILRNIMTRTFKSVSPEAYEYEYAHSRSEANNTKRLLKGNSRIKGTANKSTMKKAIEEAAYLRNIDPNSTEPLIQHKIITK